MPAERDTKRLKLFETICRHLGLLSLGDAERVGGGGARAVRRAGAGVRLQR